MEFKSEKEHLHEIEKQWRMSLPRFTSKELLEIFPQAEKIIKTKIAEYEILQTDLTKEIKLHLTIIKNINGNELSKWFCREWIKVSKVQVLLKIEKQIKRLKGILMAKSNLVPRGWATKEEIQKALIVPIERITNITFKKSGKNLVGLCPLHNERSPSFFVYTQTNSFFCHGCNKGGNSINLVRLLYDHSFNGAVKLLNNY